MIFYNTTNVTTLALGSWPKQRLARLRAKRSSGVKERVGEWTLTLPRKLPLWEFRISVDSRILKEWLQGSKLNGLRVLYIVGKLLEPKCLKWLAWHISTSINTNYGQKKDRESNWQFDSRPFKVKNHSNFLAFRWRATYCWKALNEGYNFSLDFISIRGLHTKLWGPKVEGISTLGISRLPFGSLETKCHLDVDLVKRHIVYYKGEGGGFPQVRVAVSLVSPSLPMVHPSIKSAPTMH